MRFLGFLEGVSGVRGFLVSSEDGDQLHVFGSGGASAWNALRTAAIARDFGVAGAIAGLGSFSVAAVRSPSTSRLLAQSGETIAVIEIEITRATTDIEAQLEEREWASPDLDVSKGASPLASEYETLPPQAGPGGGGRVPSGANIAAQGQVPAPVTNPGAAPPRPFQGFPAMAARAVPRPNAAPAAPSLRAAAPAVPAASRPGRPPPPSRAVAASTAVSMSAPNEQPRAAVAVATDEPTSTRALESSATSALLTGSLATFALPDLLEFLRMGQRTGTLVCASEAGLGAIHLKRGRITGAASPGVPSIGDWLVQRGVLSQEKLNEALRHHAQSGTKSPLGGTLVGHNLVSHDVLQDALMFHVGAVLRKLMTWESGAFTFDPAGADASEGSAEVEIEPQTVLLNIFKEMDDSRRG